MTLPAAINAAATPEEAVRLENELGKMGVDEILRNCQLGNNTQVTEVSGSLCGAGQGTNRICNYNSRLDCSYKGKNFDMGVEGVCKGGLHDCGTFEACVRDEGLNMTKGSFRSAGAPVPKNFTKGVANP
jgi:hypothetical protein